MLNSLRNRLRIITNKANPFNIKDQYKLLNNSQTAIAKFGQAIQLNHDSYAFRFLFNDQDKCLGHRIGQFIQIQIGDQKKPYVPISRIDDPGFVDFLIKKIPYDEQKNTMTHKLFSLNVRYVHNLQKDQQIVIRGPHTEFIYEGYGNFIFKDTQKDNNKIAYKPIKNYRYVGLIAHGTALTSFFSLIEAVATNYDTTSISLLWINESSKDICLLEQLNWFVESRKLNLNLMVQQNQESWLGPFGALSKQHIQNFMPPASQQTLIMISGPKKFKANTIQICQQLGYSFPF